MRLEHVIGLTIWQIRKSKHMQVQELAARVPMSRSYLSEVEQGHKIPSIGLLEDIADGLDVSIAELLTAFTEELGIKA